MTNKQLREMHLALPFVPFEISMADGRTLTVNHPEFLAETPAGRTIAVSHPDGTIEIVDLLLVTSLKPRRNGARRRPS
ncbi:MAG TPA: hypothetical protein VGX70_13470 [Gemmataceae bacterium]|jgi:hypothetical protein|nr:hypothetical protein [Gemmataceae bacterium]